MSKIDRPMVRKALLPNELEFIENNLSKAIENNSKVRKALFG
jgi:hypothetical protein